MPSSSKTKNHLKHAVTVFKDNAIGPIQRKLLKGEYSLALTFWIFCLAIPLTGDFFFSYLVFPQINLRMPRDYTAFLIWVLAFSFYMLIANIGLWRSAARYPSNSLAILGKIASVFGLLATVIYLIRWYIKAI